MRYKSNQKSVLAFLIIFCIASMYWREIELILCAITMLWEYVFWVVIFIAIVILLTSAARQVAMLAILILIAHYLEVFASDVVHSERPNCLRECENIEVATFNWDGGVRDHSPVLAWLKSERPAVVAIEEYNRRDRPIIQQLNMYYPYIKESSGDLLLLSRYPIVHSVEMWNNSNLVLSSYIKINQSRLDIYIVHAQSPRDRVLLDMRNSYLSSASRLIEESNENKLVLGDFNATRWDAALNELVKRNYIHEEPRIFPLTTRMAVRRGLPFIGAPIDHIFSSKRVNISRCRTGPMLHSDHLPLLCAISFSNKAA